MNKYLKLLFLTTCSISIGIGFAISSETRDSEIVKAEAETQYRSHKGRYLKNPLAVQTPDGTNFYEVIKELYNAPEYVIDDKDMDSAFVREFKTYIANYQRDVFNPYFLKTFEYNLNTGAYDDDDVDSIGLTFEGTDDPSEAITWMFATVYDSTTHEDYHESEFTRDIHVVRNGEYVLVKDVKFKPVPAYNAGKKAYFPVADFNDTSGGAYVNLYYTTDPKVGYPIQEFKVSYAEYPITEHPERDDEFIRKVTNGDWEDCDFDHGVEYEYDMAHVYMSANRYTDAIRVHTPEDTVRIDYFARKYGNPHKYYPSECSRYPGYDCKFYFSKYYTKKYILHDEYNTSCETDLYGRYEKKDDATKENQANYFAKFLMKIDDESFLGKGTGKCISDNLYTKAKDGLINSLDNTGRKYIVDTYNDLSKVDSDTSKAYKRFMAWAEANDESFTIDSDGNISFSSKSTLMVLINNEISSNEIYTPSILFIGVSCLFVLLKLKKKKHK